MIATRNPLLIPESDQLRRLMQSLAMLDAILCTEWEYRFYSFDAAWDSYSQFASMRDGSGDWFCIVFTPAGSLLKGFAHEAVMSPYRHDPPRLWPGIFAGMPAPLAPLLSEPALLIEETTFCLWSTPDAPAWQHGAIAFPPGPDPDGSAALLTLLDGNPLTYQSWAEDYYERPVDRHAIEHIYAHLPLTSDVVTTLSADRSLADLLVESREIGYPGW
jgi:hypothetical protein